MIEGFRWGVKTPSLGRQKLALGLAFLIILIVSALGFASTQRLTEASQRVDRSQGVLIEVNRYLSEIKDMESHSRAYFITGDRPLLEARAASLASARRSASRLLAMPTEDGLQPRLGHLVATAEKRIEFADRLVSLRGRQAEALQTIRRGTDLMDQLRNEAESIISSQTRVYRSEQRALQNESWLSRIVLTIGVMLCLAIIGWLFSLRGREVERRRRLEGELRGLNSDLENRVQQRSAEVRRASDLLNAVVENLPDMVLLKEPAGDSFRYLLVNAAGEQLVGRDRKDMIGRTERELFPSDEADLVIQANQAVADSGRPTTFKDRKLTTASGVRTVETRMVPIPNGSGQTALILAIVRDVTEAKAREDQLRMLQRMDAVGRLTGGVAHDFNNLLAIIHGNSELLRYNFDAGSENAEMVEDIVSAAARGAELVKRLLAFARMQHLEPEPVDLNGRLPDILALLQRSLGEKVEVRLKTAQFLWPAIVDPTQVDDAVVNLAINARDAMPEGGVLTIETRNVVLDEDYAANQVEAVPGDYVMLAVSDTGTGMSPEVIARAFEPFFTTKEEGKGTGLGLSQVFGWVKQSGGHIKIYSEIGHGTTIKLYLPRSEAASAGKAREGDGIVPGGDETILLVEDNPNVRKTVLRQVHDLGYRTVEADSAAEAMRLIEGGLKFDLLLTDVVMPGGITGYQLADQLRSADPELKVLFMSGYTELAAAPNLSKRDQLLSKPFRKQDLGRAIRAVLDTPVRAAV